MSTIVSLQDFRQARAAATAPDFSNFWVEVSLAVLNGWMKASIGSLSRSGQVVPFAQATAPARRAL
jgi:hypothetical protein